MVKQRPSGIIRLVPVYKSLISFFRSRTPEMWSRMHVRKKKDAFQAYLPLFEQRGYILPLLLVALEGPKILFSTPLRLP